MSSLAHAYVAIRDLHADGGPAAPASWKRSVQGSTGWTMITHPSGDTIAALFVNAVGTRGLFILFGHQARLESIAANTSNVMPAREAYRRGRLGTETSTRNIIRAWPWWRCDVIERGEDGSPLPVQRRAVRRLTSVGTLLPRFDKTPPPWNLDADGNITTVALATRRVTAIHGPALGHVLAGRDSAAVLEDEPDRQPQ